MRKRHVECTSPAVPRIFLATSITPLLESNGLLSPRARTSIQFVLASLRREGFDVFCAIEREKWGLALMSGVECTKLDLEALRASDLVLAFPGASYGVHVELGWASALEIPIFVALSESIGCRSPLVEGIGTITAAATTSYASPEPLPPPTEWPLILAAFCEFASSLQRATPALKVVGSSHY